MPPRSCFCKASVRRFCYQSATHGPGCPELLPKCSAARRRFEAFPNPVSCVSTLQRVTERSTRPAEGIKARSTIARMSNPYTRSPAAEKHCELNRALRLLPSSLVGLPCHNTRQTRAEECPRDPPSPTEPTDTTTKEPVSCENTSVAFCRCLFNARRCCDGCKHSATACCFALAS